MAQHSKTGVGARVGMVHGARPLSTEYNRLPDALQIPRNYSRSDSGRSRDPRYVYRPVGDGDDRRSYMIQGGSSKSTLTPAGAWHGGRTGWRRALKPGASELASERDRFAMNTQLYWTRESYREEGGRFSARQHTQCIRRYFVPSGMARLRVTGPHPRAMLPAS